MSGASPPLRSLWFGEGLTSATTEDSGRNSDATIRAPPGRLQEPLPLHTTKSSSREEARLCRNDDARQARPRAPARRLGRIRGCCCRRAAPLRTRRPGRPIADPTVQLRDAFRPAYATHSTFPTIRYSLDVPDNTLLAHRPRQHATWLMFPEHPC